MGLDITAYRKLTVEENPTLDQDGCPRDRHCVRFFVNSDFPGREGSVRNGTIYRYQAELDFRAGSYGSYGQWRSTLATLVGFEGDQDFWARAQPTDPFYPLINFSDCEGVIAGDDAVKLLADFKAHDALAKTQDEYFYEKYQLWTRAFELAADDGAVKLH